tara:strand:+ start:262 stop:1050 length:789 start_codon:yes stop_codon:yes gene_type:complete
MTIKLLDGKVYKKREILQKMEDDSFYYGELNKLALSSSSLKLLTESAKKYYYVKKYGGKQTAAMQSGWLLHTLILEPEKWDKFQWIDCSTKATKKFKEAKMENEFTFTIKQKDETERLADAILKNEFALKCLSNAQHEVPVIGSVMGMPFRGKADILSEDGICDLKTCQNIKGFKYSADAFGYDIQVYLYCQLFGFNYYDFKFLVIDKGSLDVGIFEVSEEFYLNGKNKVKLAINRYLDFFHKKTDDEIESDLNNYIITEIL